MKAAQRYFEWQSVVGQAELAAVSETDEVGAAAAATCVALAPVHLVLYALPLLRLTVGGSAAYADARAVEECSTDVADRAVAFGCSEFGTAQNFPVERGVGALVAVYAASLHV